MNFKKISKNTKKVLKTAVRIDNSSMILVMPKAGKKKVMKTFKNISNNTTRVFKRRKINGR